MARNSVFRKYHMEPAELCKIIPTSSVVHKSLQEVHLTLGYIRVEHWVALLASVLGSDAHLEGNVR